MGTRIAAVALAFPLAGCASNPSAIDAAYVSPAKYEDFTCEELAAEMQAIDHRIWELHGRLQSERATDETQTVFGLFLFWPTLLFLEGGDGPEAVEYARLKGEYSALLVNAHRCEAEPSGPALCDSYSSPADRQACLRDGDWKEPETGYRRLGTEEPGT